MADVDRHLNVGHHAHVAGLKRLSARASKGPLPATASPRKGCFSFAPLARTVMDRLRKCQVQVAQGLLEEEFCKIEALCAFTFPPDLKAILQEGLPIGAGFPDWRTGGLKQLRLILNLPIAGLSYEVARGHFWLKQWGPKPSKTEQAVSIARAALRKAPVLIPVYRHCYIPASPNLAGNPVFFVCQKEVSFCDFDLTNFFENQDFVLPDCELPYNFAHLDAASGRASSLRSSQRQSFRSDNKLSNPRNGEHSSAYKRGEGEDADSDIELTELNYEDTCGGLGGWGKNMDAMARRDGHIALLRRSFEVHNSKSKAFKRFDLSVDLSNEHHANDRLASANAAKVCRRIEFWSDLAEKRHNGSTDYSLLAGNGTFSFSKLGERQNGSSDYSTPAGNGTFSSSKVKVDSDKASYMNWNNRAPTPYWLERYFDKMAMVLRNGGWKETDLADMFDVISHGKDLNMPIDPQSMMEGLVLYVNLLSDALRRAGWSTADVAEAFDVDLSFCEQKRRPSTVPPHVAAKIGKLADYAARF